MPITLPSYVAPNELIQSAWGNGVVDALDELDTEKIDKTGGTFSGAVFGISPTAPGHFTRKDYVDDNFVEIVGDTMTGTLVINRGTSGIPLILKQGNETPSVQFQSQAGTVQAQLTSSATFLSVDTLSNNPFLVAAPTQIETGSGSTVLTLRAVTETPVADLQSTAGTSLLTLTGSSTNATIAAFDDLKLRTNGNDAVTIDGGTQNVTLAAGLTVTNALTASSTVTSAGTLTASNTLTVNGALDHNGTTVGFYGGAPITKQTGVAVTAAGVHAALVNLGLIT